jgi:hypothetical protein
MSTLSITRSKNATNHTLRLSRVGPCNALDSALGYRARESLPSLQIDNRWARYVKGRTELTLLQSRCDQMQPCIYTICMQPLQWPVA